MNLAHEIHSKCHIFECAQPMTDRITRVAGYSGYVEWTDANAAAAAELLETAKREQQFNLPQTDVEQARVLNAIDSRYFHGIVDRSKFITLGMAADLETSLRTASADMSPDMIMHVGFPYNGEPPKHLLMASEETAPELHYVRNHGNIPLIIGDADEHVLEIGGAIEQPLQLTLRQLKTEFQQHEVRSTLQCAGNRRQSMEDAGTLTGDPVAVTMWTEQAIGGAIWTGVSMRDVLARCKLGADVDEVEFVGMDTIVKLETAFNYAISVPLAKIVQLDDVFLVHAMNGKPLTAIHGAPLRSITRGSIGARSVKWLKKINLRIGPSMNQSQQKEYRLVPSNVSKQNFNFLDGMMLTDMPVNSCIMQPLTNQVLVHDGEIDIAGWAFVGGGRWIERIEVSSDGGTTWQRVPSEHITPLRIHAWRLWKTRVKIPQHIEGWIELACRAVDSGVNFQPTDVRQIWNWHGYLCNTVHRVRVFSAHDGNPKTVHRLTYLANHNDSLIPIRQPPQEEPGKDDPADLFIPVRHSAN